MATSGTVEKSPSLLTGVAVMSQSEASGDQIREQEPERSSLTRRYNRTQPHSHRNPEDVSQRVSRTKM